MKSLSRVRLFETPWTVAYQAPPSMGFSRQEYWSGLPFPSPGDLPDPGIKSGSPALEADALTSEPLGKPNRQINKWNRIGSPEIDPHKYSQLISKNNYLFILFLWLCWVVVEACRIFFSCGVWDRVSWAEIKPGHPTLGAQSLSLWTIREVPSQLIFDKGAKAIQWRKDSLFNK